MKWAHSLEHLSAYKRCDAHLTTKTSHGAVVTLLGVLLGLTLTVHELSWFLTGGGVAKTAVDLARRHDLAIHMDISFPSIPCAGLSVDVMDASGSSGNDVSTGKDLQIHKIRLDASGRKTGGREGEYHTPQSQKLVRDKAGTVMQIDLGAAMTQMGDMEKEIESHEGCRVMGNIVVRRVAGKMHFAVHQQSFVDVLPQMLTGHRVPRLTNMSHIIHKVAFGPEFPGQANPLDSFSRITREGEALKAYKYFLKIVPTEYMSRWGFRLETNQYSVSEYSLNVAGTGPDAAGAGTSNASAPTVAGPFIDFAYDLSPIMMTVAQSPADVLHFVVRLCAVVGGVLSVTRMADKLVHGLLVAAGAVPQPPSIKARHSSAGYSSTRTSLAGGALDMTLPGSARTSSFGGGGSPHAPGARGSPYSSSGGLLPDSSGAAHFRSSHAGGVGDGSAGGAPVNPQLQLGSHPLSHVNSNASTALAGMGSLGGAGGSLGGSYGGGLQQQRDSWGSSGGAANGSAGGYGGPLAGQHSGGGAASWGGAAAGPAAGGASGGGAAGLAGFGSGPLYQTGSNASSQRHFSGGGGDGTAASGGASGGGAGPAAGHLGGFSSAPLAHYGGAGGGSSGGSGGGAGIGTSRLSTASGPGSRPGSGPGNPPANGVTGSLSRGLSGVPQQPGSPLRQQ